MSFNAFNSEGQIKGDEAESVDDAHEFVDEAVTHEHTVFGDPIVGRHAAPEDPTQPLPSKCPKEMTPEEFAQHCVTHLPYSDACPYCVAGKRPNVHHRRSQSNRNIQFRCADYGFITDAATQDVIHILVPYVHPLRIYVATAVDTKGQDLNAIKRVARWIRECGLTHVVFRPDREQAIRKFLFEAVKLAGVHAEEASPDDVDSESDTDCAAAPDESHVGESQSNGGAERSAQVVKGQVRTLKLCLEDRLQRRITLPHPLCTRLVEHSAILIT